MSKPTQTISTIAIATLSTGALAAWWHLLAAPSTGPIAAGLTVTVLIGVTIVALAFRHRIDAVGELRHLREDRKARTQRLAAAEESWVITQNATPNSAALADLLTEVADHPNVALDDNARSTFLHLLAAAPMRQVLANSAAIGDLTRQLTVSERAALAVIANHHTATVALAAAVRDGQLTAHVKLPAGLITC